MKLGRLITRRRAKWVGMLMSALILGLAVASVWYEAGMVKRRPSLDTYVSLDHGGVRFEAYDSTDRLSRTASSSAPTHSKYVGRPFRRFNYGLHGQRRV